MSETTKNIPDKLETHDKEVGNAKWLANAVGVGAIIGGSLLAIDFINDLALSKVNVLSGYPSLVLLSAGITIIATNRHTEDNAQEVIDE